MITKNKYRKRKRKVKKGKSEVSPLAWLLFHMFGYGYQYLIGTTAKKNRVKIGFTWKLVRRVEDIDKSIKGSKEYLICAVRIFNAESFERKFMHRKYKHLRITWLGSGKTEWFEAKQSDVSNMKGTMKLEETKQQLLLLMAFVAFLLLTGMVNIIFFK